MANRKNKNVLTKILNNVFEQRDDYLSAIRFWMPFVKVATIVWLVFLLATIYPKHQFQSIYKNLADNAKKTTYIANTDTNYHIQPDKMLLTYKTATHNTKQKVVQTPVKIVDNRPNILREYLKKYNSPLAEHVDDLVEAADTYGIDWKLVPAIAGVESTFGKNIPGGQSVKTISYNGWGWGVYGNTVTKFKSWRDGIFTVTKGLKEKYVSRGLTTPMQMNKVYAASPTWGQRVNYYLNDIDKFSSHYPLQLVEVDENTSIPPVKLDMATDTTLAFK